jgi:recombination protein RecA
MDANRSRALDLAVSQIEKQFGKGAIMKLGEQAYLRDIDVISSGSLGLDIALGVGGLPCGRVVEIFGPESSGKTTLALQLIAEAQKAGGVGAFIDAEHALDIGYARKLGVRIEDLLISQPDNGEQALEIAETLVRSGAVDVLAVDSVAALVPRAELEGEMGDPQMGLQARLMSQPDPYEDRRHVRQSRNHHRRQRVEVLLLGAARHPSHRRDQTRRRSHWQPHQSESREE